MVRNHAEGHITRLGFTALLAGHELQFGNQRLKYVCIVVGLLALNDLAQTFKTHARIHVLGGKLFQGTVGLAQKLHEHVVPNLNHPRVVVVHQIRSRECRAICC